MEHIDFTPVGSDLFAGPTDSSRCPAVVLLHADASPDQLLGLAHTRCRELALLANLASSSRESEQELRQVAEHLWRGLEEMLTVLDAMSKRMGGAA